MKKTLFSCIVLTFCALLTAQATSTGTTIQLNQILIPASGGLLGAASGTAAGPAQLLKLGTNLSITNGTLNAASSVPTIFVAGEVHAVTASTTTFTLTNSLASQATSVAVYRNGIRQAPGVDYSYASGVVTFLTTTIPMPGADEAETILIDYQVP